MRPSPQKSEKKAKHCLFEFWRSLAMAVTHLLSDGGRNLAIGFLDKINLFFPTFFIYVYLCFMGNVAVSVWLASVWLIISCDYSDWMTAINMNADWPLWNIWPISVWLSSLFPRTSVCDYWLLSTICVNFWQYQCISGYQSMYVSMYFIQSNFFLFLSFYYSNESYCIFRGQINHFDV